MIPRSAWLAGAAAVAAGGSLLAVAARPDDAPGRSAPPALDGGQLFLIKGCATCHDGPSSASMTSAGPSLAAAPEWAGERVAGQSAAEYIAQSMRSPTAFIAPTAGGSVGGPGAGSMPLLQLSDAEIDALVDYLLTSPDATD